MAANHHRSQRDQFLWPFFEPKHRELSLQLDTWATENLSNIPEGDVDRACSELVKRLGNAGWLKYAVGGTAHDGASDAIDTRILCIIRETLSRHSGLADFAFAMQGLGSGAISLFGTSEQKQRYLPSVADGKMISAFALSESNA